MGHPFGYCSQKLPRFGMANSQHNHDTPGRTLNAVADYGIRCLRIDTITLSASGEYDKENNSHDITSH